MELDIAKLCDKTIIICIVWLQHVFASTLAFEDVFFDKFGHCQRTQPFDLTNEEYILKHVGGGFVHETLVCDITFKAPSGYGICLTYEEFEINDCSMRLQIYQTSSSTSPPWRVLGCSESTPAQMCSTKRYVTVRVIKDKLNYNRGYSFEIHVKKSSHINEKGVLFASIGVFVAVILGAVILTAILAIFVLYCCCRKRRLNPSLTTAEIPEAGGQENRNLVQPSAPPADIGDHFWAGHSRGHMYSQSCYGPYPLEQLPPPYMSPPPYQPDSSMAGPKCDRAHSYPVK